MVDHKCTYQCERPECIRRQRDELRERLELVYLALTGELDTPVSDTPSPEVQLDLFKDAT